MFAKYHQDFSISLHTPISKLRKLSDFTIENPRKLMLTSQQQEIDYLTHYTTILNFTIFLLKLKLFVMKKLLEKAVIFKIFRLRLFC